MTKLKAATLLVAMLTTSLCPAPSSALTMDTWAPAQWLTDVNAIDGWSKSGASIDVDESGIANAIWVTPGGVNLSRSTDGGETWYQVYVPDSHLDAGVRNARIAYTGNNQWVAVWTIQNFELDRVEYHISRSSDGGQTWTPPEGIRSSKTMQFPIDLSANDDGTVLGIFESRTNPTNLFDQWRTNFHYVLSTDGGETWNSGILARALANNQQRPAHIKISNHANQFVAAITQHGVAVTLRYSTEHLTDTSTTMTANERWGEPITIYTPSVYLEDVIQNENSTVVATRNTKDLEASSTLTMHRITDEGHTWITTHAFAVEPLVPESTRFSKNSDDEILMTYATAESPGKIYIATSNDEGLSWTTPAVVSDTVGRSNPAVAARPDGSFLMAASAAVPASGHAGTISQINALTLSNVFTSLTVDDHGYISELSNEEPYNYNKDLAMTFGNDHTVIAAWNAGHKTDNYASIRYRRSLDAGKTWEPMRILRPFFQPQGPGNGTNFVKLLYHGFDIWTITWLENEPDGTQKLGLVRSTDNGATWSNPTTIPGQAIGHNGNGLILAAHNTTISGNPAIQVRGSSDSGLTWSDLGSVLGETNPEYLVYSSDGNWLLTTTGRSTILSDNDGQSWQVVSPQVTSGYDGDTMVKSSRHGTMVNIWDGANLSELNPIAQASTDHGISWHRTHLTNFWYRHYSKGPFTLPKDYTWIGANHWILILTNSIPARSLYWLQTMDSGLTWSQPELLDFDGGPPTIAGRHANIVIAWQVTSNDNEADFAFTYNNYVPPVTAANDWTLYE